MFLRTAKTTRKRIKRSLRNKEERLKTGMFWINLSTV